MTSLVTLPSQLQRTMLSHLSRRAFPSPRYLARYVGKTSGLTKGEGEGGGGGGVGVKRGRGSQYEPVQGSSLEQLKARLSLSLGLRLSLSLGLRLSLSLGLRLEVALRLEFSSKNKKKLSQCFWTP